MKTRNIIGAVSFIFLISMAVLFLPALYTTKDISDVKAPPSFQISDDDNRIEYQGEGFCGAYAAAYVMRHFGYETTGDKLADDLRQSFGFTSPNSVEKLLKDHGFDAKAYHGDLESLKAKVAEGVPVIVFIRIPHDTHYAVVTGYDENHLYLADSLRENANANEKYYNRQLTNDEFKSLWKTKTILDNNIYITVTKKR